MAIGSVKRITTPTVVEIQGTLKTSVQISGLGRATIFNNANLRNAFSEINIGSFPDDSKSLIGAVYLWANASNYIPIDLLVLNGLITLGVYNVTNTPGTITSVRLLTFWQ